MREVRIFDSTLRDGAQGEGLSFSLEDKLKIVSLLDELGVSYIEAGNPGSNPKDLAFFKAVENMKLENAALVAFGSTRRPNIKSSDDNNVKSLLLANTEYCAIFGKSWDFHATDILKVSLEENLEMIRDTISYLTENGKKVFFDAEHFFDGYKSNSEYALKTLEVAKEAGAVGLVLCETRGGFLPFEIDTITPVVIEKFPDIEIAIHAHNDSGCAVANSLVAVDRGCSQVQGTLLGFGERCGNANLSTIIADLELKMDIKSINGSLADLHSKCMSLASICNIRISASMPYVGKSAFAHKGGMHIDGVIKNSTSFEHIEPETVGAKRRLLMSEVAGRALLLKRLSKIIPDIKKDSPEATSLMAILKDKEAEGYQYEGAENSFDVLIRKNIGEYKPFFELVHYQTTGLHPYVDTQSSYSHSAVVKVRVNTKSAITAAEGHGPVNALDKALRKVLEQFYPSLKNVHLVDYKVRVLDGKSATASKVRVLIDSTDGVNSWSTIGVSSDIIQASWQALSDSIEYKLILDDTKRKEEV